MDTISAQAPTQLCEPFAGGFYAGRIRVADAVYAIVVAPKAAGEQEEIRWHKNMDSVPGAISFFDGLANTAAMAEAGSPLAQWARGLVIGDFSDWYLPSRDELELCYRAFKPTNDKNYCWRGDNPSSVPVGYAYSLTDPAQTAIADFRRGGVEAFELDAYWSSTQYAGGDAYAWCQDFYDGSQYDNRKGSELRARAVRRVLI